MANHQIVSLIIKILHQKLQECYKEKGLHEIFNQEITEKFLGDYNSSFTKTNMSLAKKKNTKKISETNVFKKKNEKIYNFGSGLKSKTFELGRIS